MFSYSLTPGSVALYQAAVAVEIWEGYLLKNNSAIATTLCTYSLDNGPFLEQANERLVFRFTDFDWQNNIQLLLTRNNVHYHVTQRFEIDPLERLPKKNIFLVEDRSEAALVLSPVLKEAGYHVRATASGKEIIDGNFSRIDLFILDAETSDADVLGICQHLRLQAATKDTPIIILSEQSIAKQAMQAGASDFIAKPIQPHYLLNVVGTYMRRV